eukprot:CAMPEP_0172719460 /NCGR_PEP_ID=MMETSP1074-20121228/75518_1 /TAXON_ID=2916 /ORGANISM="Ceratium fusus, Strain PA161109" /LENGTH=136 /DNA_ID=CAMNT_0013544815 /DNA_START=492 /DNA_END=902 /DNA_ORIENTATION=+
MSSCTSALMLCFIGLTLVTVAAASVRKKSTRQRQRSHASTPLISKVVGSSLKRGSVGSAGGCDIAKSAEHALPSHKLFVEGLTASTSKPWDVADEPLTGLKSRLAVSVSEQNVSSAGRSPAQFIDMPSGTLLSSCA